METCRLLPEIWVIIGRILHRAAYPELHTPLCTSEREQLRDAYDDDDEESSLSESPFLPSLSAKRHADVTLPNEAKSMLTNLSSTCRQLRSLLTPFIWSRITIKRPGDMAFLRSLGQYYQNPKGPLISPAATSSSLSSPDRVSPLPYIASIHVHFPSDRYPNLQIDQQTLLDLFSRYSLSASSSLHSLNWEAESLPHPSLWQHLAARQLQVLEVDCKTFWSGHKNMARLAGCLKALKLTGYEVTLLPMHLPALLLAMISTESEDHGDTSGDGRKVDERSTLKKTFTEGEGRPNAFAHWTASRPEEEGRDSEIGQSLRAVDAAMKQAHLSSPSTEPAQEPEEGQDPTPSGTSRLLHLSLSSSKTSLLHSNSLIQAGVFSSLVTLDLYPVTPEPPLDLALISCGKTLQRLKFALDISGAFKNYDRLWRSLTGKMPALRVLDVDPHPQQNTAPSFEEFVSSCERLGWINGRKRDGLPPCLGLFDPDHRTGAIFY